MTPPNASVSSSATSTPPAIPGSSAPPTPEASRQVLLLLATIAGLSVANIYYIQPLLDVLRAAFPASAHWVGIVPSITQLGYATGMFFVAPLGDRFARRSIILWLAAGLSVALAALSFAPSLLWVAWLCIPVGVLSTIAQQAVPFAAELASPAKRGHAVGTVMSGLLLGILLARTASGVIAQHAGWRAVYLAAAVAMVVLWLLTWRLPHRRPASTLSYPALLASMWHLLRDEPVLRTTSITGAAMFAAFSAFWSMLSLLLAGAPFHMGAQAAGLFGLAGAAGALVAPIAGKSADRRGPRRVISVAIGISAVSFVVFGWSAESVVGLVVGVLILDAGVQAAQISNQSRIYALRPEARSRLNTVYFVCSFLGGAVGSAAAAFAWSRAGWTGVCAVGLLATAVAGLNHALGGRGSRAA